MRTPSVAPARCEIMLHEAHHSAHGMRISALCVCIGAFHIIFLRNERLLIAFLVRLICYMVLPRYSAQYV